MSDDYTADPYDIDGEGANQGPHQLVPLKNVKKAADLTKQQIMAEWLNSKKDEMELREILFNQIRLVDRVLSNIENNLNS